MRTGRRICIGHEGSVTIAIVKQRLKQALSQRQKTHIIDDNLISSAVLVPIFYKQGQYHILFTKRTERVKDHKGQISFPGGACEKKDSTALDTALRESAEEIGLAPEVVELLGELDDMPTISSGYIISPFVGVIPWPYPFKIDPIEVKELIEVPIPALLDKDCLRPFTEVVDDQEIASYAYYYQGNIIWGATYRILRQLLEIITGAMKNEEK